MSNHPYKNLVEAMNKFKATPEESKRIIYALSPWYKKLWYKLTGV